MTMPPTINMPTKIKGSKPKSKGSIPKIEGVIKRHP